MCGEPVIAAFIGADPATVPARYDLASPAQMPAVPAVVVQMKAQMALSFEDTPPTSARGDVVDIEIPESNHFQLIDPNHETWATVRDAILGALMR